jgi:large subunit ribosomal protein L25
VGKGASRRLRRAEQRVPGIIYGGGREPQPLTLNVNALAKAMERRRSTPRFSTSSWTATLRRPWCGTSSGIRYRRRSVIHIDFVRVTADQAIDVHVPLHFLNEEKCVGVRLGGGSINHNLNEITVRCLPGNLPEFIEVDVADLDVGDSSAHLRSEAAGGRAKPGRTDPRRGPRPHRGVGAGAPRWRRRRRGRGLQRRAG